MKYVAYFVMLLLLFCTNSYSQCYDVFGRETDCPTENDSLVIYSNALKVYEFYEKNPDYTKLKSIRLKTKQNVMDCFYQLEDALDSFNIRWQLRERVLNGEDIPSVLMPRGGKNINKDEYYQYIDNYRFYQRELENGILNTSSPFPIYDIRISPLLINSYENRLSNDEYNGDFVNVALYVPVTIKPYNMLTDSEKVIRAKILEGRFPVVIKKESPKKKNVVIPKVKPQIKDTTLLENANINYVPPIIQKDNGKKLNSIPWDASPMYDYDATGSLWLMGWMIKRKFRPVLPTDDLYESLPKVLKDFLSDNKKLEQYLIMKWGGYYDGIYEQK